MKFSVPETSDEDEDEKSDQIKSKPKTKSKTKSKSKPPSRKINESDQYNGPYCKPLSVQTNRSTPSPFANPPNLSKSIYSSPLKSSLNHRIQNISTSSSASSEEEEDDDEIDSEEEKWPIRKHEKSQPKNSNSTSYLIPDHDSLQVWDQEGRQSTYLLSIQKSKQRRKHFEEIHFKTIQKVNETQERLHNEKMNELSKILNQIELDQEKEIKSIAEGFERRERERNKVFNQLILEAERIEKEETLRISKLKQEEATKKAEAERKQLEIKLKAEEEEKLKVKKETELKNQLIEKKKLEKEIMESEKNPLRENYQKWYQIIEQIKQTVLPNVSSNESFKMICRQAKRKITPKVGQLTNSSHQIQKVIIELGDVLKETKNSNMNVYLWACNHLSKALIKQSETEVTAKQSTVYPLARVVIGLILIGYPELGQVMMARMIKKCYFISAYRPLKSTDESEEAYKKRLGYVINSSTDETLVQYGNRMSGIFSLYCAICQVDLNDIVPSLKNQTKLENLAKVNDSFKLYSLWTLFVNLIKSDITSSLIIPKLISTLIEVIHQRMLEVYGTQWLKLLKVLYLDGIKNQKGKFSWNEVGIKPSLIQLESILEDLLERGIHPTCDGRLYED
ncbi:GLE1-like protein-domain-containing protein [Melampsora americana]|nr:GLE1-like protein-domain-containing protein [Melampsora americana]